MKFTVNGQTYNVPIPNRRTREDFILVKKALLGDVVCREAVLGGSEEKYIYMGDDAKIRWLVLTQNSERIIEMDIKNG